MEEEDDLVDAGVTRGPRYIRDIVTPTKAEVDRRSITRLPFRNWCPHCMNGRGKEAPHRRSEGGTGEIPEISLDFCFPSKENGSGLLTILVARERHSKMTLSALIPTKTTGTFATRRAWAFLREIGCKNGDIILKCDQEAAIVSLVAEISRLRADNGGVGGTIEEHSPVGSSSSNGLVERAIQSVEEQVRVMASALSGKWKCEVPVKHAIWPWLVEYASFLLNRCNVGQDGKSAYERCKGKTANFTDHEFGEVLLWKKKNTRGPLGKLDSTWSKGIFLGTKGISEEKIVGTPGGYLRHVLHKGYPLNKGGYKRLQGWLAGCHGFQLVRMNMQMAKLCLKNL